MFHFLDWETNFEIINFNYLFLNDYLGTSENVISLFVFKKKLDAGFFIIWVPKNLTELIKKNKMYEEVNDILRRYYQGQRGSLLL